MVREIAQELAGKVAVIQVNLDSSLRLGQQYNITGVPTLLLLRNGTVIDRLSGARPRESVIAWIRRHS